MAQLRQELTRRATRDHVVAHGDTNHGGGGDVTVIARDDACDAFVHDRQNPLHLVQHVFWLDIGQGTQRVRALELDDESQRGVQAIGSAQSCHRRDDPGVEVVLLVEAERLEESVLGTEIPVQRRARHTRLGRHVRQLQLPTSIAGQHDERRREDPPSRRLVGVGAALRRHYLTFT